MKSQTPSNNPTITIPDESGYKIMISENGHVTYRSMISSSYAKLFFIMLEHSVHDLDGLPCHIVGSKIIGAMARISLADEVLAYTSLNTKMRREIIATTEEFLISLFEQCEVYSKHGIFIVGSIGVT